MDGGYKISWHRSWLIRNPTSKALGRPADGGCHTTIKDYNPSIYVGCGL
ncbi:hypothetical protein CIPAW_10G095700 [Carya illinoinensis]|uniref:Uncharacterized protein n=1 Tax=Carya illinoinensis TaxID=32201 RepID=A0A8T1P9P7_CARIL|nr:hypothetical protein CIPAW_10G095700 [Carya illinoinensis]